jgi:ABC-2 type transport system permease protein
MTRVLAVARSEFLMLVRTKAFIIGIVMMPILFGAFGFFMSYAERHVDVEDRPFAVIDETGVLYEPLAAAAERHNERSGAGGARTGPYFLPERADSGSRPLEELKVELSERVRDDNLFAFVYIPAAVLEPGSTPGDSPDAASASPLADRSPGAIQYYSETTSYEPLPTWLRTTLNDEIAKVRFSRAGVDRSIVTRLNSRTTLSRFSLVERDASGAVTQARKVDALSTFGPAVFFLVLMFVAVMTSGQHLLNAIIEEKMSRISEVLVGSVTPFQLLLGKLFGVSAVSSLLVLIYCAGGIYAIFASGRWELLNLPLLAWFVVFLICAVLMFGSMFLALGSACTTINDAQSLLQPAMTLLLLAYFGSFVAIRAPDSPLAIGMSFFPTMTPFAMMLRIAVPPGVPLWQILLSVLELSLATVVFVWAAGRIFRVGILMQGKAPNLPELLRWIRA